MNDAVTADTGAEAPRLPEVWHRFGDEGQIQRLLLVAKMIERTASRQLQGEHGLSVAQWRVLAFVCLHGPATASYIGESAEVDQAEISRAVRVLVDEGLVTREFRPNNRKTMIITPTKKGEALAATVRKARQAYFGEVLQGLGQGERDDFTAIMRKIAENVVRARDGG